MRVSKLVLLEKETGDTLAIRTEYIHSIEQTNKNDKICHVACFETPDKVLIIPVKGQVADIARRIANVEAPTYQEFI